MHIEVKKKLSVLGIVSFVCLVITCLFYFSGIDLSVHNYFYPVSADVLTTIVGYITLIGGTTGVIIISLIVLLVLFAKKENYSALFYLVNIITTMIITTMLKGVFHRARPSATITDFAFPSGHAMSSAVIFGVLALLIWNKNKKLAMGLLVLPLLVGFSRIYLDVHWVSDVFGGFFFGTLWIMISYYVFFGMKK